MKAKKMFMQWRVWLLIFALFAAYLAINPQFGNQGVVINSVELNSSAYSAGMRNPSAEVKPTDREQIVRINSQEIESLQDFNTALESIPLGSTFRIQTDQQEYALLKSNASNSGLSVSNAAS